jgi:hypothetical protein
MIIEKKLIYEIESKTTIHGNKKTISKSKIINKIATI